MKDRIIRYVLNKSYDKLVLEGTSQFKAEFILLKICSFHEPRHQTKLSEFFIWFLSKGNPLKTKCQGKNGYSAPFWRKLFKQIILNPIYWGIYLTEIINIIQENPLTPQAHLWKNYITKIVEEYTQKVPVELTQFIQNCETFPMEGKEGEEEAIESSYNSPMRIVRNQIDAMVINCSIPEWDEYFEIILNTLRNHVKDQDEYDLLNNFELFSHLLYDCDVKAILTQFPAEILEHTLVSNQFGKHLPLYICSHLDYNELVTFQDKIDPLIIYYEKHKTYTDILLQTKQSRQFMRSNRFTTINISHFKYICAYICQNHMWDMIYYYYNIRRFSPNVDEHFNIITMIPHLLNPLIEIRRQDELDLNNIINVFQMLIILFKGEESSLKDIWERGLIVSVFPHNLLESLFAKYHVQIKICPSEYHQLDSLYRQNPQLFETYSYLTNDLEFVKWFMIQRVEKYNGNISCFILFYKLVLGHSHIYDYYLPIFETANIPASFKFEICMKYNRELQAKVIQVKQKYLDVMAMPPPSFIPRKRIRCEENEEEEEVEVV